MYLAIVGFLGLVFGSFINAWVWRVRQQINDDGEARKLTKKRTAEVSVIKGRSRCPVCNHELSAKDLVPVFSWLSLGGKCRYCKAPISSQYPLVELLVAVLFIVSYMFWDFGEPWQLVSFTTWLIGLIGLVGLAVYDIKWMLLPDRMLRPLYVLVGIGLLVQFALGRPLGDIVMLVGSVMIASGVFWALFKVSGGKWIGYGDVKLGLLTGMLMGSAIGSLLSIFIASILGTLVVVPFLATKKTTLASQIPFGPFLIAGCFVVVIWGLDIINWYLSLLGV